MNTSIRSILSISSIVLIIAAFLFCRVSDTCKQSTECSDKYQTEIDSLESVDGVLIYLERTEVPDTHR